MKRSRPARLLNVLYHLTLGALLVLTKRAERGFEHFCIATSTWYHPDAGRYLRTTIKSAEATRDAVQAALSICKDQNMSQEDLQKAVGPEFLVLDKRTEEQAPEKDLLN